MVALEEEAEAQAQHEFNTVTRNLHHLVSTKVSAGVYNSPYNFDGPVRKSEKETEVRKSEKDKSARARAREIGVGRARERPHEKARGLLRIRAIGKKGGQL